VPCVTLSFLTKIGVVCLFRVREALADEVPTEATTLAAVLPLTVPAAAANVVEVAPAATVEVAGTVRAVVLLERLILVPPVGAALEMVTVQIVLLLAVSALEAHARDNTVTGAASGTVTAFEDAPSAAVTTALWSAVKAPAVTVKVVLAAPARTVTEAGTVRLAVLLMSVTVVSAGASEESVAVQTAEAPALKDTGVHVSALSVVAGGTAPPDAVTSAPPATVTTVPPPASVAPIGLVTPTVVLAALGVSVNDMTATTPFAMAFVLIPYAIHWLPPETGAQVIDLPAAASAEPALKVTAPTFADG